MEGGDAAARPSLARMKVLRTGAAAPEPGWSVGVHPLLRCSAYLSSSGHGIRVIVSRPDFPNTEPLWKPMSVSQLCADNPGLCFVLRLDVQLSQDYADIWQREASERVRILSEGPHPSGTDFISPRRRVMVVAPRCDVCSLASGSEYTSPWDSLKTIALCARHDNRELAELSARNAAGGWRLVATVHAEYSPAPP